MPEIQNEVQKLYERRGVFYHKLFVDFLGLGKRFERFFAQSNYLKSGMKILDAGCGSGALLGALYKVAQAHKLSLNNITYHGFDFSEAMLNQFRIQNRKSGINNIELVKADLLNPEQLPQGWRDYDMIISNGMLEYIPKLEFAQAIKNLKLLLKDEGVLVIFITKSNIFTKFFIEWWWKARTFKAEEINIALQNGGFTKIKINKFGPMNNMLFVEAKK